MIRAPALLSVVVLAACSTPSPRPTPDQPNAGRYALDQDVAPQRHEVPPDIASTPDAVPRAEPRSAYGNPASYEVLGRTYRVLASSSGFRERGYASWYGKKFHGHRTSSGEPYDMFKMTAAHKTLPLPTYVRVTRVDTGRSVVVRVNDRGPFHKGRIIDLSYAAAARLDMLGAGSAMVEISAIDPGDSPPPGRPALPQPAPPAPATDPGPGWLQVAVYADPINAIAMREQLASRGVDGARILVAEQDGLAVHRVVLGPFASGGTESARNMRARLQSEGFQLTWLRDADAGQ